MIECFRSHQIEDPQSDYHLEAHQCFVCGGTFDPTPGLRVCEECRWYRCPDCGGCLCSLSPEDQVWLNFIRSVICQSPESLAFLDLSLLPETQNPNLRAGILTQLHFCQKEARKLWREAEELR